MSQSYDALVSVIADRLSHIASRCASMQRLGITSHVLDQLETALNNGSSNITSTYSLLDLKQRKQESQGGDGKTVVALILKTLD